MGGKIIFILILVVALGLGLYLYSSGAFVKGMTEFNALFPTPTSSIFAPAPSSSSSTGSSGGSFWSFFGVGTGKPDANIPTIPEATQTYITAPGSGAGAQTNPALAAGNIPAGFTAAQLSPYYKEVQIGSAYPATFTSYGAVTLYGSYGTASGIDVTGWQIVGTVGSEYVPQAVNVYDPTGFAPATDIVMKGGDTLYLYSNSAPFNLRLNECTGYMAHVAQFSPPLPLTCPYPNQAQIQEFSGQCQNFIQSIQACGQPDFSSPQIPQNDYACMNYLENNYTYRSCFNAHYQDPNFLSNQIWAWTGSNIVGQYHDTLKLFDRNGLLVDIYNY